MRALELTLVLLCAAFSIRVATASRNAGWVHAAEWLLAAVLLTQIVVEGWRWQMMPAYAATVLAVVATPVVLGLGVQALLWCEIASIGLLAASIVFCLVLPFVQPPVPHGPYAVGATALPVSVSRPPDAVEDELKAAPSVRLWYPAKTPVSDPSSRFLDFLQRRLSEGFQARPTLRYVADAPIAPGSTEFPVIVYFDGWPEDTINNVNLVVELVSHGFAVATVQYPARSPGTSDAADTRLREQLARDIVAYSSDQAFGRSVELNHARARIHAEDAIAVLNTLAALDSNSANAFVGAGAFAHRLDTQRAGTLGFSFGGAIACEASRLDPRIKAVVNLDGRHWGEVLYKGVERPYMLLGEVLPMPTLAELTSPKGYIRYEAILDQMDFPNFFANIRALGGVYIRITGTAHMNFTDIALRSPLHRFSQGGAINARRAQQIVQAYAVAFFSRYLLADKLGALQDPWPQFPEAQVQVWPGQ
jgi:predicted dienelactone hydrolase